MLPTDAKAGIAMMEPAKTAHTTVWITFMKISFDPGSIRVLRY